MSIPIRSFAEANRELAAAFDRFQLARGRSARTIRSYREAVAEFIGSLKSESVLQADRAVIRRYQTALLERGVHENTVRLRIQALRAFFKFVSAAGLTSGQNPTLLLSYRKLPGRIERVLTIAEVEKLIATAESPLEAAIAELLYATGVRVSELVHLRFEDVDFANRVIRVRKGKGGKDRIVLFGSKAADALRRYLQGRKPAEFLFETTPGAGSLHQAGKYWHGAYFDKDRCCLVSRYLGKIADVPREDAMRAFQQFLKKVPGFRPRQQGPYVPREIRYIISRMSARAGLGHVHPHMLRRAFACHLLEAGADLRVIQDLMGHVNLTTTMIYTSLTVLKLKEIHGRCHPHAKEDGNAEEN
jgi:site-specific recombinase XerD